MKLSCVYLHRRGSDGRVFYVGKGSLKRAKSKSRRSPYWQRIAKKHGFNVQIVKSDMPEPCAFSFEMALISAIGKENLCNLTDGGEGARGNVQTNEQKLKLHLANKGRKPAPHSIELARAKNSKPIGTRCGLRFPSATEAAKWVRPENWKAAKASICGSANGKTKHSYGYEWGYIADGSPVFLYQSRTSQPRPHKWRPVSCSNGMRFDALTHAVDWLKYSGHQKASAGAICRAAKSGKMAYGMRWHYV